MKEPATKKIFSQFSGMKNGSKKSINVYCQRVFNYLQEDDSRFSSVLLSYRSEDGTVKRFSDQNYPFEFTIPLIDIKPGSTFWFSALSPEGKEEISEEYTL